MSDPPHLGPLPPVTGERGYFPFTLHSFTLHTSTPAIARAA